MSSQIDPSSLVKLHTKMVKCAQRKRHPSPEDIAQEYVCRLLEGLHQHATVDQAYIDILRLRSGRKGKGPGYDAKIRLHSLTTEKQMDHLNLIVDDTSNLSPDELLDLKAILLKIKHPQTKKVFHYKLLGLNNKEIGKKLGVGESRISQIIKVEIQRLQEEV